MFLMIENPGVAPVESYTTIGLSTARGRADQIGQFGSGTKQAITLLLRKGIAVFVYLGNQKRLEFKVMKETIVDATGEKVACHRVVYRINKGAWKSTSWTLDMGSQDWDHVNMALREFVSNALDAVSRIKKLKERPQWAKGNLPEKETPDRVNIELTDNKRAKEGVTRVLLGRRGNPRYTVSRILEMEMGLEMGARITSSWTTVFC